MSREPLAAGIAGSIVWVIFFGGIAIVIAIIGNKPGAVYFAAVATLPIAAAWAMSFALAKLLQTKIWRAWVRFIDRVTG